MARRTKQSCPDQPFEWPKNAERRYNFALTAALCWARRSGVRSEAWEDFAAEIALACAKAKSPMWSELDELGELTDQQRWRIVRYVRRVCRREAAKGKYDSRLPDAAERELDEGKAIDEKQAKRQRAKHKLRVAMGDIARLTQETGDEMNDVPAGLIEEEVTEGAKTILQEALGRLTYQHRRVLEDYYLCNFDTDKIGTKRNLTLANVYMCLSRARQLLAKDEKLRVATGRVSDEEQKNDSQ